MWFKDNVLRVFSYYYDIVLAIPFNKDLSKLLILLFSVWFVKSHLFTPNITNAYSLSYLSNIWHAFKINYFMNDSLSFYYKVYIKIRLVDTDTWNIAFELKSCWRGSGYGI